MIMKAMRLLLFSLVFCVTGVSAPDQFRNWTNADGRVIEASFAGLDGTNVKLKLRNGTVAPVALEKLSAADQEWVKQNGSAPPPASTGSSLTKPGAAASEWPKSVLPADAPKATAFKEDAESKEFIYRTEHFEFQCPAKLGAAVVREFARMFEGTYEVNRLLPLAIDPKPEKGQEYFVAKLYATKEDYLKDGGIKGSAGIYSSGAKAIKVPLGSLGVKLVGKRYMVEQGKDSDTLIHEITHQMMNHWLGKLPEWYVEGSAMYVGSSVFHPSGRFTLPKLGQTDRKSVV